MIKNLSFYQNDWIFDIIDQYYNDQDSHKIMGSKKGVAITVGVLVAITIGSFMVWFGNPTSNEMTIVVTDFENHDAGIVERHKIVQNSIESSFDKFMNNEITVDEYEKIAETGSSQNNALLMELAYSDAPQEWQETYINRIASLKSFEAYIIETMVIANLISDNGEQEQITEIMENIEKLKEESSQYAEIANSSKP